MLIRNPTPGVRIGDVGFPFRGRFIRMFNVTEPLHTILGIDAPKGFVQLKLPKEEPHDRTHRSAGPLSSAHVNVSTGSVDLAIGTS